MMICTGATSYFGQNVDLPFDTWEPKKKPYLKPLKGVVKSCGKELEEKPLEPPANGLLIPHLIPIAHNTMKARATVLAGTQALLEVVPVKGCRYCSAMHVGPVGHHIANCRGRHNSSRHGRHDWVEAGIEDVLPMMEVFHLSDRLGKVIAHEDRNLVDKVPAVVELCIQAGVDIPEYPTKRRTNPVVVVEDRTLDFDDLLDVQISGMQVVKREKQRNIGRAADHFKSDNVPNASALCKEELADLAEKTMQAWFAMRHGAKKLMTKYMVYVCGYCPRVHVGPRKTRTRDCSAHKHEQRDGHHGWQEASVDDLIPPKYVWHVREPKGSPLATELRVFYGAAPAIVELCVQAGAKVPEECRRMMRLDVVIPDLSEVDKVA